jgi:hypothetical protein
MREALVKPLLGAVILAMLAAPPAYAQNKSSAADPAAAPEQPAAAPAEAGAAIERITGSEMATILQEIGWTAEAKEVDGKPFISANYTDAESGASYDFTVGLYRCDETTKACYDVMFMRSIEASKPVTLKMVNKYNATQMFGVAYLNDDGSLGISMTQTIQGGVTRQNLKEMADWWKTIITGFDAKVTGG